MAAPAKEIRLYLPPDTTRPIFDKLHSVERYHLPHILRDNSALHTVRTVAAAEALPEMPGLDKQTIVGILWYHDMAEAETGDISAVAKENKPALRSAQQINESEAAARMLDGIIDPATKMPALALWRDFETAGDMLKGHGAGEKVMPEAIIAKIIDMVDGNLLFHRAFSGWIGSGDFDGGRLPDTSTMVYTKENFLNVSRNLRQLDLPEEIKYLGLGLLQQQLQDISACWQQTREKCADRIPAALAGFLAWVDLKLLINL